MAEKKNKRPEAATAASQKCEFCKKTGSHYEVDYHLDRVPPEEFKKFRVLYDEGFYFSIIRCRRCRTIYKRNRYVDNEICNESDEDVYVELSEEELNDLLRFFKKRQKEFTSEIHRRLRGKISSLSRDERAVINIFCKCKKDQLSIYGLMEKAKEPLKSALEQLLKSLVKKSVLKTFEISTITHYRIVDER